MPRSQKNSKNPKDIIHTRPPPPKQPETKGGGLVGSLTHGFALGTGSQIAHTAIGSLFSSSETPQKENTSQYTDKCKPILQEYTRCVENNSGYLDACKDLRMQLIYVFPKNSV